MLVNTIKGKANIRNGNGSCIVDWLIESLLSKPASGNIYIYQINTYSWIEQLKFVFQIINIWLGIDMTVFSHEELKNKITINLK